MYTKMSHLTGILAKAMALLGGAVLIVLVIMTCLSIAGRALVPLGTQPIKGDYELIEMGIAFAVFAFLPWCQYMRGHAVVNLLQPAYPRMMNRWIDVIADAAMFGAAVIIAWRLYAGLGDKIRFGETTFILQLPVWWAYAAGLVGAVVFALVAAFCLLRSIRIALGYDE